MDRPKAAQAIFSDNSPLNFVVQAAVVTPLNVRSAREERAPRNDRNRSAYFPNSQAKISGATIVASDSMMNFGVSTPSFPHVIFSFGTAPE